jgi:hypothetical protein
MEDWRENQTRSLKHSWELMETVAGLMAFLVKEMDFQYGHHLPDQKYVKLYKYCSVTIAREY